MRIGRDNAAFPRDVKGTGRGGQVGQVVFLGRFGLPSHVVGASLRAYFEDVGVFAIPTP